MSEAHLEQFYAPTSPYAGNANMLTIADPADVAAWDAFIAEFNEALAGYAQYVVRLDRSNVTGARTIGVETVGMPLRDNVDGDTNFNPMPIIEGGAGENSGKGQ